MNRHVHLSALLHVEAPSRFLVVAAGHVGNNIFCTPALQLLRKALADHAVLDVVALNSASANVFEGNVAVDRVHVVRGVWGMARLAAHYDQVICLHPKSACLLKRVGVPVVVIPPFDSHRHYAEQILAFAASLVGRTIEACDRCYELGAAARNVSTSPDHVPRIGIHLGCGRTAIHGWKFFYRKRDRHPKLWSTESYIELADRLRQCFPNAEFVVTGTRNERFLARRFAKSAQGVVDLTGKTSVSELAKTIGELDLFITQDCGVLHVAAATATPLLALFGPTNPALTGPWPPAPHHRILQRQSMAEITPEMAASAAIALLQERAVIAPAPVEHSCKQAVRSFFAAVVVALQQHDFLNCSFVASSSCGLL